MASHAPDVLCSKTCKLLKKTKINFRCKISTFDFEYFQGTKILLQLYEGKKDSLLVGLSMHSVWYLGIDCMNH